VIPDTSSGSSADAVVELVGQTDAAARTRELITWLTRRRAASGLSQAHVARLMKTSQSAVARFESGQHDVLLSSVARYAEALGLSLELVPAPGAQSRSPGPGGGAKIGKALLEEPDSREQPTQGALPHVGARPKGRPGWKPKDEDRGPGLGARMPDRPDPDHVLTWRQLKVLQVIRDSVQDRGYPPSMREIGEAVGLTSTSSVSFQLATLESKGYLRRDAGRPRTVETTLPERPFAWPGDDLYEDPRINTSAQEMTHVPVIGRIAAGDPILAEESLEEIITLPRQLVGEGTLFLLRVAGDSMIGAAIADGDWVVVRQQLEAENGDIVAAMIDGETTVKTFKRSGGHIWLMPHNPAYTPIPADEACILGRLVAVLRRL
jgi:repressor LexA